MRTQSLTGECLDTCSCTSLCTNKLVHTWIGPTYLCERPTDSTVFVPVCLMACAPTCEDHELTCKGLFCNYYSVTTRQRKGSAKSRAEGMHSCRGRFTADGSSSSDPCSSIAACTAAAARAAAVHTHNNRFTTETISVGKGYQTCPLSAAAAAAAMALQRLASHLQLSATVCSTAELLSLFTIGLTCRAKSQRQLERKTSQS